MAYVQSTLMETSSEPAWLSAILALGPHLIWAAFIAFIVVYLREPISEALRRLSRASTPIGTVEMEPRAEQATEPGVATAAEAVTATGDAADQVPPKWIAGNTPIPTAMEAIKPYVTGEKRRNDEVDLAVYWMISWAFESTLRVIWGTQIQLVQRVDVAGEISVNDARAFYNASRQKGNRSQTFEQYVAYIIVQGLIAPKPDGTGYTKTPVGHQFVVYLSSQSIAPNRPW